MSKENDLKLADIRIIAYYGAYYILECNREISLQGDGITTIQGDSKFPTYKVSPRALRKLDRQYDIILDL